MTRSVPITELPADVAAKVRAASVGVLGLAAAPHLAAAIAEGNAKAAKRAEAAAKHERRVAQLLEHLRGLGVTEPPVRELEFARPVAAWRFDFAWPGSRVALEADGGAFLAGGGRHGRGAGFREDVAKRNAAALMGWRVIHCLTDELGKPGTAAIVASAIQAAPLAAIELPQSILDARQSAARKRRKPPAAFLAARKGKP